MRKYKNRKIQKLLEIKRGDFWEDLEKEVQIQLQGESLGQVQVLDKILIPILTNGRRGKHRENSAQAHTLSTEPAILTRCARIIFMTITSNLKEFEEARRLYLVSVGIAKSQHAWLVNVQVTSLHVAFRMLHTMALIDYYSVTPVWHYKRMYAGSRDALSVHRGYSRLSKKELRCSGRTDTNVDGSTCILRWGGLKRTKAGGGNGCCG
ncbi:hypothetical protein VNO77_38947 [Canavalia gladiata]|uniref:Uncharacterized protein n=1 Tax=Canavalia gladiata TaxID=3824 RepID=A0AAN9KDI7_CANGL